MCKQAMCSAIGVMPLVFTMCSASASDLFVAPRLEIRGGYENNRMEESGEGDGSLFWQTGPGLDMTIFRAKSETSLLLDYRRTQYAKSEYEFKDDVSAMARWRYLDGQNEAGADLGGGIYRDGALPYDDNTFWQASPCFMRTLEAVPVELTLNGNARQAFYDASSYTSATERVDTRMEVRPGLQWHVFGKTKLWGELYAESNSSEAKEAEYTGFGGALGCLSRPLSRLDLSVWAETGTRSYSEQINGDDRGDVLCRVGVWTTYRLRSFMELFSSAEWDSIASTIDGNDYTWWQVGFGVKLVFEQELDG